MREQPRRGSAEESFSPLKWEEDVLLLLDQTRLPVEEVWLPCQRPEEVAEAVRRLAVRGAPAIGVAAAYGLVLALDPSLENETEAALRARFDEAWELLASTRPTAVNLRWALEQGQRVFAEHATAGRGAARGALLRWARDLHRTDVETNERIGAHGEKLFSADSRVLTHCNTGSLATAGYGTALGVIRSCWQAGKL